MKHETQSDFQHQVVEEFKEWISEYISLWQTVDSGRNKDLRIIHVVCILYGLGFLVCSVVGIVFDLWQLFGHKFWIVASIIWIIVHAIVLMIICKFKPIDPDN